MTTISVVIPLFNKAAHIEKTLQSVFSQSVRADEIIVVDDGSTDGGREIVESFASKGVMLIRQENSGASVARNRGVAEAKSQFVAFLDADDWWLPDHLFCLKMLIEQFPQAGLYSTAFFIERNGARYRPRSRYQNGWLGLVEDFFGAFADGLSIVSTITACVKKSALVEVGGFPAGIKQGQDLIAWFSIAMKYPIAHYEMRTAVYYQDAGNRVIHRVRESRPPGSLSYLAELMQSDCLQPIQRRGMQRLFDKIAFFTCAGYRLNGHLGGISAVRKLAFEMRRYKVGVAIAALSFVPPCFLRFASEYRHPKADNPFVTNASK